MRDRLEKGREFLKGEGGAALAALGKAAALLGTLSEAGWLLHTRYFSRYFPQLPISLAWAMLSMIFFVVLAQLSFSVTLKITGARRARLRAAATARTTEILAAYLAGADCHLSIERAAGDSPRAFESCVAAALLRLRGSALNRLCDLPDVMALRDRWIASSRSGDEEQRRQAVEQLSLLRDPAAISALEAALEDSAAPVAASAVRGLLRIPGYEGRDALIASLPLRPFLVRVLTACENRTLDERARPSDGMRRAFRELASRGANGQRALRRMSAAGTAGEAPAEALSAELASAVRGGLE
jgi:hypothetical protein